MQIKLFYSSSINDLEKQVNEFLNANSKKIKLRQISNSECESSYSIMIVYEPRMDIAVPMIE